MNSLEKVEIKNKSGNLYVSSRVIAKKINKLHKNVLRELSKIEGNLTSSNLSSLKLKDYFILSEYKDRKGENRKEYLLTKKGFVLYMFNIQGYNDFKISYIEKFEEMEQALRNKKNSDWLLTRENGKLIRRKETDIIQELILYAINQGSSNADMLYMSYSKLVNKLVDIPANSRDKIEFEKLLTIRQLEDLFTKIISECMSNRMYYKDIYSECKKIGTQFMSFINYNTKALNI
jgi:hypothetical protein fuD12_10907